MWGKLSKRSSMSRNTRLLIRRSTFLCSQENSWMGSLPKTQSQAISRLCLMSRGFSRLSLTWFQMPWSLLLWLGISRLTSRSTEILWKLPRASLRLNVRTTELESAQATRKSFSNFLDFWAIPKPWIRRESALVSQSPRRSSTSSEVTSRWDLRSMKAQLSTSTWSLRMKLLSSRKTSRLISNQTTRKSR